MIRLAVFGVKWDVTIYLISSVAKKLTRVKPASSILVYATFPADAFVVIEFSYLPSVTSVDRSMLLAIMADVSSFWFPPSRTSAVFTFLAELSSSIFTNATPRVCGGTGCLDWFCCYEMSSPRVLSLSSFSTCRFALSRRCSPDVVRLAKGLSSLTNSRKATTAGFLSDVPLFTFVLLSLPSCCCDYKADVSSINCAFRVALLRYVWLLFLPFLSVWNPMPCLPFPSLFYLSVLLFLLFALVALLEVLWVLLLLVLSVLCVPFLLLLLLILVILP